MKFYIFSKTQRNELSKITEMSGGKYTTGIVVYKGKQEMFTEIVEGDTPQSRYSDYKVVAVERDGMIMTVTPPTFK